MKAISKSIAMSIMQTKEYRSKISKSGKYKFPEELREPIVPDNDGTMEADLFNLSNLCIQQDEEVRTKTPQYWMRPVRDLTI